MEDDKKRPVEKHLKGGRSVLNGTILLVVEGVRETRLEDSIARKRPRFKLRILEHNHCSNCIVCYECYFTANWHEN
jgi:hypothetical protein